MKKDELVERARARAMSFIRRDAYFSDCIAKVLAGDVGAVPSLFSALNGACGNYNPAFVSEFHDDACAIMTVLLYEAKIAEPAYAAFLGEAWRNGNHQYIINKAGSRAKMSRMFKHTGRASDLPAELGDVFTIYRGVQRTPDIARAARGYSWTFDRDVACWFAVKHGAPFVRDNSYVIAATIRRSDVVYYSDDRGEKEIVTQRAPENYKIDGDLDDWIACGNRQNALIKANNMAHMNEIAELRALAC